MSTVGDDDGIDWEDLETIFDQAVDTDIPSVVGLNDAELMRRYHETFLALQKMRKIRFPDDQQSRDLHSIYGACQVELRKRKLIQ